MKGTLRPPIGAILSLAASTFFFWLWYERYLRIGFNGQGRYYDAQTQLVYTDSAFAWWLPACGFLLLALVSIGRRVRRRFAAGDTPSDDARFR